MGGKRWPNKSEHNDAVRVHVPRTTVMAKAMTHSTKGSFPLLMRLQSGDAAVNSIFNSIAAHGIHEWASCTSRATPV